MNVRLIKDLLEEKDTNAIEITLVTGEVERVENIKEHNLDSQLLYVTEPVNKIINLNYVVKINNVVEMDLDEINKLQF